MSAIESHAVADRFARVREAFHRLVEVDLSQRHAALQALSQSDPEIAAELRLLLDRMDEADLLAAPEQAPPSRLGPFRLLHRIGRGGMGEVWLAERVEGGFEQQVALKRVREAALTPDLARRFVRERQILARLQHPNIAHLIDGGVGPDGRPWLAMEYVPRRAHHALVSCTPARCRGARTVVPGHRKFNRPFRPVCEVAGGGARCREDGGALRLGVVAVVFARPRGVHRAVSRGLPAAGRARPCGVLSALRGPWVFTSASPSVRHAAAGGARAAGR
jgi:hypothetical protein